MLPITESRVQVIHSDVPFDCFQMNFSLVDVLVNVPVLRTTQSLFDTKIGMIQTFSTVSENWYGPATPLRLT